jgi:hypothetical protein
MKDAGENQLQVPDDVALLDMMLEDQAKQPQIYGTTNFGQQPQT